jgi:sulfide:quinone oxidoreductase
VPDAGAELIVDAFRWLDAPSRVVHTRAGRELAYDALLLALGARTRPAFRHVLTLDDRQLADQLSALLREIEEGTIRSVAALVPSKVGWPVPMYEVVLLLARHAQEHQAELEIALVTAEETPLAVFGAAVSQEVAQLLAASEIRTITAVSCEVPVAGVVSLRPGVEELTVDRVIALPLLYGPSTPGVPKRARGGFISVDPYCRVRRIHAVYAAGDATDFPVKFGSVAAQQADIAALSIALAAGAEGQPAPFHPVIHGVLISGKQPLYLSAHLVGGQCHRSEIGPEPTPRLPATIAADHLAPYLAARSRAAAT